MRKHVLKSTAIVGLMIGMSSAQADMAAADKFLADEIAGVSVLSAEQQKAEMKFINLGVELGFDRQKMSQS